MDVSKLQIVYPHTVRGVLTRIQVDECADALDTDSAIDYIKKITADIRKTNAFGCFHVSALGGYNLCVSMESDGSVELLFQHIPSNSQIKTTGTARNQMKLVRQIVIEHFEGTQSFDKQLEVIYETN